MTVTAAQLQAAILKIAGILTLKPEQIELVDATEPDVIQCVSHYRKEVVLDGAQTVIDRMVVNRITREQYTEALSQPAWAKRNAALAAEWGESLQGELSYRFTVKLATQITVTLKGHLPFIFTYNDTLVNLVNDLAANRPFIITRLQSGYVAIRNQQRLTTDITPAQFANAIVTSVDDYIAYHRLGPTSIGLFHGGRGFQHATLLKDTVLALKPDMVSMMRAWVKFSGKRADGSQCGNSRYSLNRFILDALKNYRLWSAEIYLTGIDVMVDYQKCGADTCQALIDCLAGALHKLEQKAVHAPEKIVPLLTASAPMPVTVFNNDEEETKTPEQLEYWAKQGQPLIERSVDGIKQAASTAVHPLASFDSLANTANDAALNLLANDDLLSLSRKQGTTL